MMTQTYAMSVLIVSYIFAFLFIIMSWILGFASPCVFSSRSIYWRNWKSITIKRVQTSYSHYNAVGQYKLAVLVCSTCKNKLFWEKQQTAGWLGSWFSNLEICKLLPYVWHECSINWISLLFSDYTAFQIFTSIHKSHRTKKCLSNTISFSSFSRLEKWSQEPKVILSIVSIKI